MMVQGKQLRAILKNSDSKQSFFMSKQIKEEPLLKKLKHTETLALQSYFSHQMMRAGQKMAS